MRVHRGMALLLGASLASAGMLCLAPAPQSLGVPQAGCTSNEGSGDIAGSATSTKVKLTETADTSDVCTVPERAAVTYEVVPWASPDCAELRGTDASVDAWCAAHEDWVDTAVAPPYQCSDGSSPQPPTKIRSRPITTPEPPLGSLADRHGPVP